MSVRPDMRKARHEASHAAVALVEGIGVDFATVVPKLINETWCEGYCKFSDRVKLDLLRDKETWLDRFARAIFAGRVSDELLFEQAGVVLTGQDRASWAGDAEMLMNVVSDLTDFVQRPFEDFDRWRAGLLAQTRAILSEPKVCGWVDRITAGLLERKTLSGEDVVRLLGETGAGEESGIASGATPL